MEAIAANDHKEKLLRVPNLGDKVGRTQSAFEGCTNLTELRGGVTSAVITMHGMFERHLSQPDGQLGYQSSHLHCPYVFWCDLGNPRCEQWDTRKVTHMNGLFLRDISKSDVVIGIRAR